MVALIFFCPYSTTTSFIELSLASPVFPCLNQCGVKHQTTQDSPCNPEPTESIQLDNPKLAYLASPNPFHKNHNKKFCPQFSLTPPAS